MPLPLPRGAPRMVYGGNGYRDYDDYNVGAWESHYNSPQRWDATEEQPVSYRDNAMDSPKKSAARGDSLGKSPAKKNLKVERVTKGSAKSNKFEKVPEGGGLNSVEIHDFEKTYAQFEKFRQTLPEGIDEETAYSIFLKNIGMFSGQE
jgi:hypothetical protein